MFSFFEWGAKPYHTLVSQPDWRRSCVRLVERFPPGAGLRALDVGCGSGASAIAIAEERADLSVIGVDLSRAMLALACGAVASRGVTSRVRLCRADAAALPFASGSFDAVTAHSVLYLVADREGLLAEARRVLRPGGVCVFMEPAADGRLLRAVNPFRSWRFAASMLGWRVVSRFKGRYTRDSLADAFERAGFADVRVEETLKGLGWLAVAEKPGLTPRPLALS